MADDFSVHDIYIDDDGLIFYESEDSKYSADVLQLQPTRQDVGNNPNEIRPDYGNFFAQDNFSYGQDQRFAHHQDADARRFLYQEGFDIFHTRVVHPGRGEHLVAIRNVTDRTPTTPQAGARLVMDVADSKLYVNIGDRISFASDLIGWSSHFATASFYDLASSGDTIYAAAGPNGIDRQVAGGAWSVLWATGDAYRVAWLKDRLIVLGQRTIHEMTAGGAIPAAIQTIPTGWVFERAWEHGNFIYASAFSTVSGMSRIFHYYLDTATNTIKTKGSSPMPRYQFMYVGVSAHGTMYVAGGRKNISEGLDPIAYRCTVDNEGYVSLIKIAEGSGAGANELPVHAMLVEGEHILMSWSTGSDSPFGERTGLAAYHTARDAFAHHMQDNFSSGLDVPKRVDGIASFLGRTMFTAHDLRVFQSNDNFVTSAEFVSSISDHRNAGLKVHDQVVVKCEPLPAATSIGVYYSTMPPEDESWTLIGTIDTDGSTGQTFDIDVVASDFVLRLLANGTTTATPEITGFEVRSNPAPETTEHVIQFYARLLPEQAKDEHAEPQIMETTTTLRRIRNKTYRKVEIREPGITWNARLEKVTAFRPAELNHEQTAGEPEKVGYIIQIVAIGKEV